MSKLRSPSDVILSNGRTLEEILESHKKWLNGEKDGKRANLSYENLSYVDLSYVDLRHVDFSNADLSYSNLSDCNLSYTDLRGADLIGADLSCCNFKGADLSYSDLRYSDLSYSNLNGADLSYAILNNIKFNHLTSFLTLQCPEKGSFIAYKKVRDIETEDNLIIEMLVTEDSLRSSATTRKCRFSKIKVLSITSLDGEKEYEKACSGRDKRFIYEVGEIIEVKDFNKNRWNECSAGIHGFITRQEAVNYKL